jgi:hypothetical protein
MRSLYNNKLQQRMYTPLNYEQSIKYIGCYYQRQTTAFDKSVIEIVNIMKDGTVEYVEKEMIILHISPEKTYDNGGTSIPTKTIAADKTSSSVKKGRLVYSNIDNIVNKNFNERRVVLWVDKYLPYELTDKNQAYTVMLDGWSPYTATNYGKYGTWNLEKIKKMSI